MGLLADAITRLADDDLPALVYFDTILRESVKALLQQTEPLRNRQLLYSAKAATFPFLLRALLRHGVSGFDASSPMEAAYIRSVVGPDVPIVVTAPALTEEDAELLRSVRPTRVHADSMASLQALLPHVSHLPIGLRVNPCVGDSPVSATNAGAPHCRLGIALENVSECLDRSIAAGASDVALHFHIACGASSFSAHVEALARLSLVIAARREGAPRITSLNIGGGLLPPTWDFARDTLVSMDWTASARALAAAVADFVTRSRRSLVPEFAIWLEPGDALVCAAAILVARVSERRTAPNGDPHVIVNTNIHHFPTLLIDREPPQVVWPPATDEGTDIAIAGNSCLAYDIISRVRTTVPFDRVAFEARGGYEFSRMTFFNGRLRPSVFYRDDAGQLSCEKRDTLDDLSRTWSSSAAVDKAEPRTDRSWFFVEDGRELHYSRLRDAEISFPPSLAQTLIGSFTQPGDTVLDPFAGYGTTAVVAAKMGRTGIGIELDPERQRIAARRLQPPHRIFLGDCNVVSPLDIGRADMVLTSPPHWQERGDAMQAYATPPVPYSAYLDQFAATLRRITGFVRPLGTVVLVVHNISASRDHPGKPLAWDLGRIAAEQLWFEKDWIACMSWQEIDATEFGNHAHCLIYSKRPGT